MDTISMIVKEIDQVTRAIDGNQYDQLVSLLQQNRRYFLAGEGRSGLIMKAIAMRMMHAGKRVYVTGETITPSIQEMDILLVMSGSGTTISSVNLAKQAMKSGADVFLITADEDAITSPPFTQGIVIPAATKSFKHESRKSIQPLGNQFDQAAHLVLDAAIIDALQEVTHEEMKKTHSNLE